MPESSPNHQGPAPYDLERAIALVRRTQGRVAEEHLAEARNNHTCARERFTRTESSQRSPTTVGLLLEDFPREGHVVVNNVMFGGPAYVSKQIAKGDLILRVDGMALHSSDNVLIALEGSQIPGTNVIITLQKAETGEVKDVQLQRMLTETVADKRRMFDLFSRIESRAKQRKDTATLQECEQVLSLWTEMLLEEQEKDELYETTIQGMQGDCNEWLDELLSILEKMDQCSAQHHQVQQSGTEILPLASPRTLLDQPRTVSNKNLGTNMQLADLISFCEGISAELSQNIAANITCTPSGKVRSNRSLQHAKTTIGIMLHGLVIDQMVEGGPAHKSMQLEPGDVILKVDGKDVTEDTFPTMVTGSDMSGSIVTLTVLKANGEGEKDVTIRRMSREAIEDQVTMFELFTNVKEQAAGQDDVVAGVDACIEHWTAMLKVSHDSEALVAANIRSMQEKSGMDAAKLIEALSKMREFSKDRQHLEQLYEDTAKMLQDRMDEVIALNNDLLTTRGQIMRKAKMRLQRERVEAKTAVEKAEMGARQELQALQKLNQDTEAMLRADILKANTEAKLTLEQVRMQAEKQHDELKAEKSELTKQLKTCQADLKAEAQKVQELAADVKVKATQLRSLQEQFDSLKLKMKEEIAARQSEIDDKKKDLAGLLLSLTEKQSFQKDLLTDLKNTAHDLGQTQEELRKAQQELAIAREQASLRAEFEKQCVDLREQLSTVSMRAKELQLELRAVQAKAEEDQSAALERSKMAMATVEESAKEEALRLTGEAEQLKKQLAELDRKHEDFEQNMLNGKSLAVVRRVMHRLSVMGWQRWREHTEERKQLRAKMKKFLLRCTHRGLVEGYAKWWEHVMEAKSLNIKALKVVRLLMNNKIAAAFERWCDHSSQRKRLKSTGFKVVHRFMARELVMTLKMWHHNARESKLLRAKAQNVVLRLTNRALVLIFERWHDQTGYFRDMKVRVTRTLKRMSNLVLCKSFERWEDHIVEERALKQKAWTVVRRLMNMSIAKGFYRWQENVEEETDLRSKALKVANRFMSLSLVTSFERWRDMIEEEKMKQEDAHQEHSLRVLNSLQEESSSQKVAMTELKDQLKADRLAFGSEKQVLESQIEALKVELDEKEGQVQIVKVQAARAQRSCLDSQKQMEESAANQAQHRERTVGKLAERLLRKNIREEFDTWRELTTYSQYDRRVEWLEENLEEHGKQQQALTEKIAAQKKQVEDLQAEFKSKTNVHQAQLEACQSKTDDVISKIKDELDFERHAREEAMTKIDKVERHNDELLEQLEAMRQDCEKAAEKQASNAYRMAAELTEKQMEIERLNVSVQAALAHRESMKRDFAVMNDELTEYRFRLGEKGIKMSPRNHRHVTSEEDEKDDEARFSAEQKYFSKSKTNAGGKYFMC